MMRTASPSRYDDPPPGAVRLNITLAPVLLRQLDEAATAAGFTRSGFLAQAVREKLAGQAGKVEREPKVVRAALAA